MGGEWGSGATRISALALGAGAGVIAGASAATSAAAGTTAAAA